MSNIYIQEPPTNGKVLLKTGVGDIDIELWTKEAPKACRNFVQLCLEGYYTGTIFHRLVSEFIVQGGDPTGTGHGGESIYGKPFKDEFHSRLRFVRRGLVAMANSGPNDNGSQFFFTLGPTQELQNKHTIFGKVGGDTIYNMIKLQNCEVDQSERPLFPIKIHRTQVLANPFDDIVPRVIASKKDEEADKKVTSKSKATKNFSLLSFGEEAEEDEEEVTKVSEGWKGKSKSSHDLTNDPKLSSVAAVEMDSPASDQGGNRKRTAESGSEDEDDSDVNDREETQDDNETKSQIRKKLKKSDEKQALSDSGKKPSNRSEELRQEAEQLKKELRDAKKGKNKPKTDVQAEEDTKDVPDNDDPLADFKRERQKYKELRKQQGKKGSSRENITLSILDKFKDKLNAAHSLSEEKPEEENVKKESPKKRDDSADEMDNENDISWLSHTLNFDEERTNKVLDANVHDVDRYEIFDPRNPLTKRRREASKQAMKEKK